MQAFADLEEGEQGSGASTANKNHALASAADLHAVDVAAAAPSAAAAADDPMQALVFQQLPRLEVNVPNATQCQQLLEKEGTGMQGLGMAAHLRAATRGWAADHRAAAAHWLAMRRQVADTVLLEY